MEAIEIRNLKKNYKDFTLDIDSLNVKSGYVTGFIGPNGSGKTTTINSIMGMIKSDDGEKYVRTGCSREKVSLADSTFSKLLAQVPSEAVALNWIM